MKTKLFIVSFFLILSFSNTFSQEQTIKLKLQQRHEYIFENIDKKYVKQDNNSERLLTRDTKEIKLVVDTIAPGKSVEFTFQYLKNTQEKQAWTNRISQTDYFFPNFSPSNDYNEVTKGIFCRFKFKFSMNLQTNEIKLINREDLLDSFKTRLIELDYNETSITSLLESINKKKWFIDKDLVGFLAWFNNSKLTNNKIINSEIRDRLKVVEKSNEFVNLGDTEFDKIIPGKTRRKYWVNLETGIVTNYSSIRIDSIQNSGERFYYDGNWRIFETNFRLKYSQPVQEQKLFVSGKIENPLSNQIHIRFLDSPFGTTLKTQTVILDKNGAFSISFDYSHPGFLYVENENNNKHNPPGTYIFYTEPGDTIHFESTGADLPWQTKVAGTRPTEQKLLLELREKIKKPDTGSRLTNISKVILDNEFILPGFTVIDGIVKLNGDAEPYFAAIKNTEEICLQYKNKIPEKAYTFIVNELKSYFSDGILKYGNFLILEIYSKGNTGKNQDLISKIDQIDINDIYNDYGLESRKCVDSYLTYHFTQISKIQYQFLLGSPVFIDWDPDLDLQFSRTILSGSPLYRNIAQKLMQIFEDSAAREPLLSNFDYQDNFALEKLNLLIQKCNDPELVEKAKQIITQYTKIQTGHYVPDLEFVNIENQKVTFRNYLNNKPTIFYFSSSWTGNRYEYDLMADGMPELNFVMVVEGSNFEHWKEYTNRAEPVAKHLLYFNNKKSFTDIFQKNTIFLVFNKDGELIGNEFSAKGAAKLAVQSLSEKKLLNKSQLKIIVITLLILLAVLIFSLFIWRWRVRQRFRKEQQQRRLRELELTAIRSQMNPHFLFNSLNSVQNLVQQNKGREAHLYLADFAGLIRKVLQNSEKEEVSLAEELEMTQQYLNLEKLRFDFNFSIFVDENIDANNTMVPSILLQPFVENAVNHGLQNKTGNRQLKVSVTRDNTEIKICIEDNGIGREAAKKIAKVKNGKGSKLMKERLEILREKQGEKYYLEISDITDNETGTRVTIFIPEEN